MGAYLHIGFVAEATAEVDEDISSHKLLEAIQAKYPADTYDYAESEDEIILSLKPEGVRKNLSLPGSMRSSGLYYFSIGQDLAHIRTLNQTQNKKHAFIW